MEASFSGSSIVPRERVETLLATLVVEGPSRFSESPPRELGAADALPRVRQALSRGGVVLELPLGLAAFRASDWSPLVLPPPNRAHGSSYEPPPGASLSDVVLGDGSPRTLQTRAEHLDTLPIKACAPWIFGSGSVRCYDLEGLLAAAKNRRAAFNSCLRFYFPSFADYESLSARRKN